MANPRGERLEALHRRAAAGDVVIMDGGTGTGLQALGVPMDGEAWGGVANVAYPDMVRRLHADYLEAGAQILIANTFATGPGPLTAAGCADRFDEINRAAVGHALAARAGAGRDDVVVAGSMSRDVANGLGGVASWVTDDAVALRDGYRRQAAVLADAGVEVIALEMMGAATHAGPAVEEAAATGLPVWLGVSVDSAADGSATTIDGEDVGQLLDAVLGDGVDAVFVMHSDIGVVADALPAIRSRWDGAIGAYPHHGDWTPPNWVFYDITPRQFGAAAADWVKAGATIVGGCCGIGPEHIAELTRMRDEGSLA